MTERSRELARLVSQTQLVPWRTDDRPLVPRPWVWALLMVSLVVAAPLMIRSTEGQRGLLGLALAAALIPVIIQSPNRAALLMLPCLAVVGGLRRWLIPAFGWTATDPLLLVGPAVAVFYCLHLWSARRLAADTRLARVVAGLMALMVLQIANPLQGGPAVGLAGALFYVVPPLWFWVARVVGTEAQVRQAFAVTVVIALLAGVYGLYQTWFGFLPSEQQWIEFNKTFTSMAAGGTIKAFSFFTSQTEYAQFLAMAIVLLWAACLKGHRLALLPVPLLALALFLESIRGAVVETLFACALLWALQGRSARQWAPRGLIALAIAGAGLVWSLNEVKQVQVGDKTSDLVAHQVNGLTNPLDARQSTATGHFSMLVGGIVQGVTLPIGRGLGVTTIAGNKFGEETDSTEVDYSNMFVSLGVVGGVLYLYAIVLVWMLALHFWGQTRSAVALGIVGILAVNFGSWLSGGYYATSMLVWFLLGALDRLAAQARRQQARTQAGTPQENNFETGIRDTQIRQRRRPRTGQL